MLPDGGHDKPDILKEIPKEAEHFGVRGTNSYDVVLHASPGLALRTEPGCRHAYRAAGMSFCSSSKLIKLYWLLILCI